MMRALLFLITLLPASASAAEQDKHCLARVIYREAQGEPVEGVVVLGQTAVNLADKMEISICKLERSGQVHSQPVPELLKPAFHALADVALKHPRTLAKGADHWDVGRPHMRGQIKRHIRAHTFYKLEQ